MKNRGRPYLCGYDLPSAPALEARWRKERDMKKKRAGHPKKAAERLRKEVAKRKGGFRGLATVFRMRDKDKSGSLNASELEEALLAYGLDVTEDEVDFLSIQFDKNKDGTIDYCEFLMGLKGQMNNYREQYVRKVFDLLDLDGSGEVTVDEIAERYDVSAHPKVVEGTMTKNEALEEFLHSFEGSSGNKDGLVSWEEFKEYYAEISVTIESDDFFGMMLKRAWGLEPPVKKAVPYSEKVVDELLARIREAVAKRKSGLRGLGNVFKRMDSDNSGFLNEEELTLTLRAFGVDIDVNEAGILLHAFDRSKDGKVSYDEFIAGLRGHLNPTREDVVRQAFEKCDVDGSGVLTVDDIKKLTEGNDGKDSNFKRFLQRMEGLGGDKDGQVTWEEFKSYYEEISSSIDRDDYFLMMVRKAWKLEIKRKENGAPSLPLAEDVEQKLMEKLKSRAKSENQVTSRLRQLLWNNDRDSDGRLNEYEIEDALTGVTPFTDAEVHAFFEKYVQLARKKGENQDAKEVPTICIADILSSLVGVDTAKEKHTAPAQDKGVVQDDQRQRRIGKGRGRGDGAAGAMPSALAQPSPFVHSFVRGSARQGTPAGGQPMQAPLNLVGQRPGRGSGYHYR